MSPNAQVAPLHALRATMESLGHELLARQPIQPLRIDGVLREVDRLDVEALEKE